MLFALHTFIGQRVNFVDRKLTKKKKTAVL